MSLCIIQNMFVIKTPPEEEKSGIQGKLLGNIKLEDFLKVPNSTDFLSWVQNHNILISVRLSNLRRMDCHVPKIEWIRMNVHVHDGMRSGVYGCIDEVYFDGLCSLIDKFNLAVVFVPKDECFVRTCEV